MIFHQITTFINVHVAFVYGLQTLESIDFSTIYQLKYLEPESKSHPNFYEHCGLMKKYIHPNFGLVNKGVRPLLFTKPRISLNRIWNMRDLGKNHLLTNFVKN